jgi:hypothetical protein
MGAERKDTDPTANRADTAPGLGPGSGKATAASDADDDAPELVDFDALHAALGDPIDYEEMPSGPALEKGVADTDDLEIEVEPATVKASPVKAAPAKASPVKAVSGKAAPGKPASGKGVRGGESSGQSSATYASARPHTIPPTRAPNEDLNAPAVIVAIDETATVPTAAPKMTVQMKGGIPGYPRGAPAPHPAAAAAAVPRHGSSPNLVPAMRVPQTPGNPAAPAAHPSSGSHPASPVSYPFTPAPFPVQRAPQHNLTMRMPDRPLSPKRNKSPTIVVRGRGPSAKQKLLAFMAALLLVTACGIAVIIWRKPSWIGLESLSGSVPSAAPSPSGGSLSPTPSTGSTSVPSSSTAAASPTGSTGTAAPASSSSGGTAASGSPSAKAKPKAPPPGH